MANLGREFHPVADIFPLMSGAEYDALRDDIAANGLLEPIWLHSDGRIIDGRNRYIACRDTGVTPKWRVYEGPDEGLVKFVVSLNLKRRHLDEGQRAMVAGKVANLPLGGGIYRRPNLVSDNGISLVDAAETLNVSRSSVISARKVISDGIPELVDAVEAGDVSVSAAAEVATLPPDEQIAVLLVGPDEVIEEAKKIKEMRKQARQAKKQKEKMERIAQVVATSPPPVSPRLIVGRAEYVPEIEDETVDLIITSPPYNLGNDNWPMGGEGRLSRNGMEYDSHSDTMPQDEYEAWQVEVFRELYRVARFGASFFYNHKTRPLDGRLIHPVSWVLSPDNPWVLRQEIIWARSSTHNHSATLFWPVDERIYWMTKGKPVIRSDSIGRPTIWDEFGPVPNTWHPAPFTKYLPMMLMDAIGAEPGMTVLDPFAGSCTTLIAALEKGCNAIGVDISGDYLETAARLNGWEYGRLQEGAARV